jgi:ATP-dependent DNA helicase DinG
LSPTIYAAIDLETTGLRAGEDEIIEVGIVTFQGGKVLDEWSTLIDPGRSLPSFITTLTGITPNMVDGSPSIHEVRGEIDERLSDYTLVGHSISFDLEFLYAQDLGITNHRLDTLTLASILLPFEGRYSLASLASSLNLTGPGEDRAHRALDDARRTAKLFFLLQDNASSLDVSILEEIVRAGRRAGWPESQFFEEALRRAGQTAFTQGRRPPKLFQAADMADLHLHPADEPESIDEETVSSLLRPGGLFSQSFTDFEHRPQQIEMLEAVTSAFNGGQHLLVEAGTGTGKSLGYLLPAVFWATTNERRVVISTNTINLQDQLLSKDIPELQRILPVEFRAAVLKGKRNYLCTRLFQQLRHSGPTSFDEMSLYARLLVWLPKSKSGDISEISLRTPGERLAWTRLNAENDVCTTDKCAVEKCPLHSARRQAEQAHILVVNHALLLADVASENRVLPEYLELIVDEAHHLEDAVTNGLSFQADKRFIASLLDEVNSPRNGIIADLQRRMSNALPPDAVAILENSINKLRTSTSLAMLRLEEFFDLLSYFIDANESVAGRYAFQLRLTAAIRNQSEFEELADSWDNLGKLLSTAGEAVNKLAGAVADAGEAYDIEDHEELWLSLTSLSRRIADTSSQIPKKI